MAALFANAQ